MRIKRDYTAIIKNYFGWIMSRFKPLTIHTELIMDDDCFEEIKKRCNGKRVKIWHLMTPANYDYYRNSFNVKLSKKELSKKMKERYLWMKDQGETFGLHIHFCLTMKNMTYKEQDKMFKEGFDWMKKELGVTPEEFVPGWWSFNDDTLKLCEKYNLKMIKERDYDYTHDYHWVL